MTYTRTSYGALFSLVAGAMFACATPARADSLLTVSASGSFGAGVTADQLAAPDATWALSFDLDSNPAVANTDPFSFDAPFSDFKYLLNGFALTVTPDSIRFFSSGDGGLFAVFFGPETGFNNGMPIPEFSLSGAQVFSGTTTSPTILPGSYPSSDTLYSDALNFDDEGALGAVSINTISAPPGVPEPSTFWLLFAALALAPSRD